MRDPFPFQANPALVKAVEPWARRLSLPTLPLHIHEVLGAAMFYTFVQTVVSPVVSTWLFPGFYPQHNRAKKANWDTHVVSLVQSLLINGLALWTLIADDERRNMDWEQRVWGYTGACGMIQALAAGYFVWDLGITLLNLDVFGLGLLAHAVSALAVYTFGFRPYLNYYSPIFILYELSTPFLNFHWFFDKLNMTGSKPQLYNGIALLATFFSCRLVWGTYQSTVVYIDMWRAACHGGPDPSRLAAEAFSADHQDGNNVMLFARDAGPVPFWLTAIYVASNLTLNALNWHWFFKMIAAVRKRFEPPPPPLLAPGEKVEEAALPAGAKVSAREERKERITVRHRRAPSIEDVVPDSEELREGTIQ